MRTFLAFAFIVASGCTPSSVPGGTTPGAAGAANEQKVECHFDYDCPGTETCFADKCWMAPAKDDCTTDFDCPGGSCRVGHCSFSPPDPSCMNDSDCFTGTCIAGKCS